MSFHFNWDRLNHFATDAFREYINAALAARIVGKGGSRDHDLKAGVDGGASDLMMSSNTSRGATLRSRLPASSPSGGAVQSLRITSLSFGSVPPYVELVAMDDALDFSEVPAHATSMGGSAATNESGIAPPLSSPHQAISSGTRDDEGDATLASNTIGEGEDSLASLFGPNGVFLKLHFTYGGNANFGIEVVLRHFIKLGGKEKDGAAAAAASAPDIKTTGHNSSEYFHGNIGTPNVLSVSSPAIIFPNTAASPTTATSTATAASTTDYEVTSASGSGSTPVTHSTFQQSWTHSHYPHQSNHHLSATSEGESFSSPITPGQGYHQTTAIYNASPQQLQDHSPLTADCAFPQPSSAANVGGAAVIREGGVTAATIPILDPKSAAPEGASLPVPLLPNESPFGIGLSLPLHIALSSIALDGYICVNLHQNECKVWLEPGTVDAALGDPNGYLQDPTGNVTTPPATPTASTSAPSPFADTRTPLSRVHVELMAGPKALPVAKKRGKGQAHSSTPIYGGTRQERGTSNKGGTDGAGSGAGRDYFYNGQNFSSEDENGEEDGNECSSDGDNEGRQDVRGNTFNLFGYSAAAQQRASNSASGHGVGRAGEHRHTQHQHGHHHYTSRSEEGEEGTFVDQQFVTQLVYNELQALLRHHLVMPRYMAFPLHL